MVLRSLFLFPLRSYLLCFYGFGLWRIIRLRKGRREGGRRRLWLRRRRQFARVFSLAASTVIFTPPPPMQPVWQFMHRDCARGRPRGRGETRAERHGTAAVAAARSAEKGNEEDRNHPTDRDRKKDRNFDCGHLICNPGTCCCHKKEFTASLSCSEVSLSSKQIFSLSPK